jgi:hypothetical protein
MSRFWILLDAIYGAKGKHFSKRRMGRTVILRPKALLQSMTFYVQVFQSA